MIFLSCVSEATKEPASLMSVVKKGFPRSEERASPSYLLFPNISNKIRYDNDAQIAYIWNNDMEELFGQELFTIGSLTVRLGQLVQIITVVGLLLSVAYVILVRWLPRFYNREDTATELRPRARRVILWAVVILSIITVLRTLGLDFDLLTIDLGTDHVKDQQIINIKISTIVKALLVIALARLLDWQ